MLADELDYLVGVDTHRDEHAVAIVDARTGAVTAQTTAAASARGYADAVRFADRHAPRDRLWTNTQTTGRRSALRDVVELLRVGVDEFLPCEAVDEQRHEVGDRCAPAQALKMAAADRVDLIRGNAVPEFPFQASESRRSLPLEFL